MLVGEDRRRHKHRCLFSVGNTFKKCSCSNLGFAEAYISAKQPIHGKRFFHVTFDFLCSPELIARFLVRKGVFEFFLPDGIL